MSSKPRKSVNNQKEISKHGSVANLYCDWCEETYSPNQIEEKENGEWVCDFCLEKKEEIRDRRKKRIRNLSLSKQIKELTKVKEELIWWDRVREKYDTYSGLDTKKVKEYKKLLIKEIREYIDFRLKEDQEEEKNV